MNDRTTPTESSHDVPEDPSDDSTSAAAPGESRRAANRTVLAILLPLAVLVPSLSAILWQLSRIFESPAPDGVWYQLWTAFDIGTENNVGTWYASTLWLLLGFAAATAAVLAPRHRPSWGFFALVCLVAAADESAALHERLLFVTDRIDPHMPFDLHYTWVILGVAIAITVAVLLVRLIAALRRRSMALVLVAGSLFLLGAVVIETFTGFLHRDAGMITPEYVAITYVEEFFELAGVSLAIAAIVGLFRISRDQGRVSIAFDGYRDRSASRR